MVDLYGPTTRPQAWGISVIESGETSAIPTKVTSLTGLPTGQTGPAAPPGAPAAGGLGWGDAADEGLAVVFVPGVVAGEPGALAGAVVAAGEPD